MQGFDLALFEQIEFLILAGMVLVLAYLALEHKEIVYAAFFFGFMASFVAGFYLLLEAPFIAGMQIAVYTGGISTLIIFAVLILPRVQDSTLERFASPKVRHIGFLITVTVTVLSGFLAAFFPWAQSFNEEFISISRDLNGLAQWLWFENGIYVQMIAIIIVTSLVGAIALLKMDKAQQLRTFALGSEVETTPIVKDEVSIDESKEVDS